MKSHLVLQRSLLFHCMVLVLFLFSTCLVATGAETDASPATSPVTSVKPAPNTPLLNPENLLNRPVAPESSVVDVWAMLLQDHINAIDAINTEVEAFRKQIPELGRRITEQVSRLEDEFKKLSSIAQVSRGMPAQRTVVIERIRRIHEQLLALTKSVEGSITTLTGRLNDLTALEADTVHNDSPLMQEFQTKLTKTRQKLTELQQRLTRALGPAMRLQEDMASVQVKMLDAMPELWSNYYLTPLARLYELASWDVDVQPRQSFTEMFRLRLSTELPQSITEWFLLTLRLGFLLLPVAALLFLAWRALGNAPDLVRNAGRRIVVNSMPFLCIGLALHYGAWVQGNLYQLLASVGTMVLCWGQITLAWDLACFESPQKTRLSPLWLLFAPALGGMLLLYLDPVPLLLSLIWLLILAMILVRQHSKAHHLSTNYAQLLRDFPLAHGLLRGAKVVLWLCLVMTLFGWARLSILLSMGYLGVAVCLQQSLALVRVGSSIEELLPNEGLRGLLAGLAMALILPALLLLLTVTPVLWVLAYPGGAYLLRYVAGIDFNVGEISFNAMQVFSIFIAFYLTRALISVGRTFLTTLRRQGVHIASSLHAPFQTAYTYLLWAFFGLYVLSSLGFSLTSLAVIAGGLSVGVGFGLQNIVQNFISGLMVIFGQTIREGDVVEVDKITGVVRKVNIRSTQIETYDNAVVFIPNSQFLSTTFTNWTHNGRMVRREIKLGVAYGTDMEKVMLLLIEGAKSLPQVLRYPEPAVFFNNFGESSLEVLLRFWVADYDMGLVVNSKLRLLVEKTLRENNVEISFPQLDIHVHNEKSGQAFLANNSGRTPETGPNGTEASV